MGAFGFLLHGAARAPSVGETGGRCPSSRDLWARPACLTPGSCFSREALTCGGCSPQDCPAFPSSSPSILTPASWANMRRGPLSHWPGQALDAALARAKARVVSLPDELPGASAPGSFLLRYAPLCPASGLAGPWSGCRAERRFARKIPVRLLCLPAALAGQHA